MEASHENLSRFFTDLGLRMRSVTFNRYPIF